MEARTKVLIGIGVVLVLGSAAALSATRGRERGVEVRVEEVQARDLVEIVTASGNIRARRAVDMSSDISARVAELLVDEGDDVVRGQILLKLEPDQYEAAVRRAEATLAQMEAQRAQQEANLIRAERDLDRLLALRARDSLLVSRQQVEDAQTTVDVARATLASAEYGVEQARAALEEAQERLSKTIFRAPMDGRVTRLNVEEGETVIVGTMNNPGSLVLTISDLSVMEVVVQVDETDVPDIAVGDSALIRIDAFPDTIFTGRVTEIGNSAINPPQQQTGGQQAAIDFEVVITLDSTTYDLRPDLSATADIIVDTAEDAVAVPIIALTVRELHPDTLKEKYGSQYWPEGVVATELKEDQKVDVEGVFLVHDHTVSFQPVRVGITGQEYFQILEGVNVGDTVVAGPYQRIRQLKDGDAIRITEGPVIE